MIPFETNNHKDPDRILRRAKKLVVAHYNEHLLGDDGMYSLSEDEVYIVWFAKTIQNWKALLSTDVSDGRYYELTHNGDKGKTYIDTYVKESNFAVDEVFE